MKFYFRFYFTLSGYRYNGNKISVGKIIHENKSYDGRCSKICFPYLLSRNHFSPFIFAVKAVKIGNRANRVNIRSITKIMSNEKSTIKILLA